MQITKRKARSVGKRTRQSRGGLQVRPPATPLLAARRASRLDDLLNPEMFGALADGTRLRLLACLAKCARSCSVSEIGECCDVDLSVVSRHLAILEEAGIVGQERQGRNRLYHVRFERVSGALRGLADALDECAANRSASGACCAKGCCA